MRPALAILLLVLLYAAAACGGEGDDGEAPTATAVAQSRTQVERYLDLIDDELAERLRSMLWVLDGSDESEEFVSALTNLEQGDLFPGHEQTEADISEILDVVQAAPWYSESPPGDKRLLVASLLDLYSRGNGVGFRGTLDALGWTGEWWPDYPWKTLIREVIQQDLHVSHVGVAGKSVQLIAWGSDEDLALEVLGYADQHLEAIEEIVGPYEPSYMLLVIDPSAPEGVCGLAVPFLTVRFAVLRPNEECNPEVTVAHEMTHLIRTTGIAPWFDEGIAGYLGFYVTGQDIEERVDRVRERFGGGDVSS